MSEKRKTFWPWAITIIILVYIGSLLAFAFYSRNLGYNLVKEDYYRAGLRYQEQINRIERAQALNEKISWKMAGNKKIEFRFPGIVKGKETSGTILFFNPADARKDYSVKINLTEDGRQTVDLAAISKGVWKLKILWETDDLEYYNEDILVLK